MKKLLSLLCIAALAGLVACGNDNENQQQAVDNKGLDSLLNTKPDWSNTQVMKDLINNHYMDNVFMKNRTAYTLSDAVNNKEIYFEMMAIVTDSLFPTSDHTAYMTIKAKDQERKDSLLLDCRFFWNTPQRMSDTIKPHLKLEGIQIRRVNTQDRYFWKKNGKFWEKVAAATTKQAAM